MPENKAPHWAQFRFYAELNDLIAPIRRDRTFRYTFSGEPAVKDAIEALGVPHTEVELILVNGGPVNFQYQLRSGDRVSVYPMFESLDIRPLLRLRPRPLRQPRFILDVHLGKLTRLMRLLGLDSVYRNDYDDETIVRISGRERRIILTRDRGLLKHAAVTHGYCVRSTKPSDQIVEVIRRFDLLGQIEPFGRCIRCNEKIEAVTLRQIQDRLPERIAAEPHDWRRCAGCGQIYWQGSHYHRMREWVERLVKRIHSESAGAV